MNPGIVTNQTTETQDALNCEAEMMTALSRLFGEAYMRGRTQGRNEARLEVQPKQPKPVGAFGDGLVERLARIFKRESRRAPLYTDMARAILTELAAMPVELPKIEGRAVHNAVISHVTGYLPDFENDSDDRQNKWNLAGLEIGDSLSARLAPILAAKDARVALLEQDQEEKLVAARRYIADLEKRLAEPKVLDGWPTYHDITAAWFGTVGHVCVESSERMIELFKKSCVVASPCFLCGYSQVEAHQRQKASGAPVASTGKTPGEVNYEAYATAWPEQAQWKDGQWVEIGPYKQRANETAAQAVLRAFGQNTADALRRVRGEIVKAWSFGDEARVNKPLLLNIIDSELADITDPQKPTKPAEHVHEVGSCTHCDQSTLAYKCPSCKDTGVRGPDDMPCSCDQGKRGSLNVMEYVKEVEAEYKYPSEPVDDDSRFRGYAINLCRIVREQDAKLAKLKALIVRATQAAGKSWAAPTAEKRQAAANDRDLALTLLQVELGP